MTAAGRNVCTNEAIEGTFISRRTEGASEPLWLCIDCLFFCPSASV